MDRFISVLETLLASPIFWGVVALIALAFTASGRFSVTAATVFLWIAWGAAVFGLYRAEIVIKLDPVLRWLVLITGAGLLAIGTVLLGRWFVQPRIEPTQVAQQTPAIEEKLLTLRQLFDADFDNQPNITPGRGTQSSG